MIESERFSELIEISGTASAEVNLGHYSCKESGEEPMKFASRRAIQGLLILVPPSSILDTGLGHFRTDELQYSSLLRETQQLRGRVYLEDGAVDFREILTDGRLTHPDDERSL